MMSSKIFSSFSEGDFPSNAEWTKKAEASLRGRTLAELARKAQRGAPGWPVLCTAESAPSAVPFPPSSSTEKTALAQIYTVAPDTHPRELNTLLLQDLEGSVSTLRLRFAEGVDLHLSELRDLFTGIHLDLIQVTVPPLQVPVMRDLFASLSLSQHIQQNLIVEHSPFERPEDSLGECQQLVSFSVLADRGASDQTELACALSFAAEQCKSSASATDLLARTHPLVSMRSHHLTSLCKVRALRRLWPMLSLELGKIPISPQIHTETAWHELSIIDIWSNLLRTTSQTAAAFLGGAQVHTVRAHDARLAKANPFGHRLARNIHNILTDECQLSSFVDPAAGSFALESQTEALCKGAWDCFLDFEKCGGWAQVVASGKLEELICNERKARIREERRRKPGALGVAEFPNRLESEHLQYHECPESLDNSASPTKPSAENWQEDLFVADVFAHLRCDNLRNWPQRNSSGEACYTLCTIGPSQELSARKAWVENTLLAAGFVAEQSVNVEEVSEVPDALSNSPQGLLLVFVASDALLANNLPSLVQAARGFRSIVVGGRVAQTSPGFDQVLGQLNLKTDVFEVLEKISQAGEQNR